MIAFLIEVARGDRDTDGYAASESHVALAAAQALGKVVTAAMNEIVEIDEATWTRFVEPVGPVTVPVDDPVGEWPAGDVVLQPEDVGRFLAARAADEPDLARVERQQAFWTAWLPLVRDAGERALPGEVETGIGRFVRVIAAGEGGAEAGAGSSVATAADGAAVGISAPRPRPRPPRGRFFMQCLRC